MAKDKSLQRLLNFFGIAVSKSKSQYGIENSTKTISPGKQNSRGVMHPIQFPTDIQRAYEYFLSNYAVYNSNKERFNRYQQCEFMIKNEGLMSTAAQIYVDESYETKDGQKPIQIKAKDKKVEPHFYDWLSSIGFNSNILREIAYNIVVYGDAFWINGLDLINGINAITLLDPYLVKDKIEFNLGSVNNVQQWSSSITNITNKYRSLQQIADLIKKEVSDEDYYLYYQSYLLGYELKFSTSDDSFKAVPPWAITHFRHFTTNSEFAPFGKPLFIHSLARYQSYKTTEMLIDMLRVASFPKEHIKVTAGETLTALDRMDRINEVREMLENITPKTNVKDNLAIGETIYSVDGLFEYEVIESGVDIDNLGDLEMKLDDLILSTGIPDSFLIPSRGGGLGGESAQALLYNNKIFQRRVEGVKSAILEGLSHTYRLHLEILDKFDGEKTEFELFMPVNAEMASSDKISFESDMLRLATDMMNNLGQALGMDRGESLPEPVVRDIFKQYLPIDNRTIDKWINLIVKKEEENEKENVNIDQSNIAAPMIIPTESAPAVGSKPTTNFKKKEQSTMCKQFIESFYSGKDKLIREIYFLSKKELGLTEGHLGNYFYYNDTAKVISDSKLQHSCSVYSSLRKYKNDMKRAKLTENSSDNN